MNPASEILLSVRCVALVYVHIAMQQKGKYAWLSIPGVYRATIC